MDEYSELMRSIGMYRLTEDHEVVLMEPPYDFTVWTEEHRRVGKTRVGTLDISTVFIPIDMSYGRGGPPIVFETMVFNTTGEEDVYGLDLYMERCSTWDQAVAQHERICHYAAIKQGIQEGVPNGPDSHR
jgi:hypothetical protein